MCYMSPIIDAIRGRSRIYPSRARRYFHFHLGFSLQEDPNRSNFKIEEECLLTGQNLFQPNPDPWVAAGAEQIQQLPLPDL